MAERFYPQAGADMAVFTQSLLAFANANLIPLGLTLPQITPLQNSLTAFQSALLAQTNAQNAAQSATENRQLTQSALEANLQQFNTIIQASPTVTDPQRESMGLPVRKTTRTPTPKPTTRPVLQIDTSQRLQHTISFTDQDSPESRKKPDGVRACKIFEKIGAPQPVNNDDYNYVADDTKSPYINTFQGEDIGKTVYYIAFWVNSTDERGPVSEVVSATVTG